MKIDKSIFSLALMARDENNYNGTLGIRYNDRVLNKFATFDDSLNISEEENEYPLTDDEKNIIKEITAIIDDSFEKNGLTLGKWILQYSYQSMSTVKVEYTLDNGKINYIDFNLIEDRPLCVKLLELSRKVTKRLLDKL